MTADHCLGLASGQACNGTYAVFNAFHPSPKPTDIPVSPEDVFACKKIVYADQKTDLVVMQLDRQATPRFVPAKLRSRHVKLRKKVAMIGFPKGLPMKVDANGVVLESLPQFPKYALNASLDAFHGNSASGVYSLKTTLL